MNCRKGNQKRKKKKKGTGIGATEAKIP